MTANLNKDENVGSSSGSQGFVSGMRAADNVDHLHSRWSGSLGRPVNSRRGRGLSRQNLVNGAASRPIQPHAFHWEVGITECASANLHPLVPGLG